MATRERNSKYKSAYLHQQKVLHLYFSPLPHSLHLGHACAGKTPLYHLHQGGLSVLQQDCAKTAELISMKLGGTWAKKNPIHFSTDLDQLVARKVLLLSVSMRDRASFNVFVDLSENN